MIRRTCISSRREISAAVEDDQFVVVKSTDLDNVLKFPGIWLRDKCQCVECFHRDLFGPKNRLDEFLHDFIVKSRPGAKNFSYLSEPLPLQTDLPYYEYKTSVTLLHFLVLSQSAGGWNTLTDGFHIANVLRKNYPHHFSTLPQTAVDWNNIAVSNGVPCHYIWRLPVINLYADGNIARINHSIAQHDSHFSVDIVKVIPWYEANAVFVRMAHDEAVTFKNVTGDVLTFNNLRLIHCRTGYCDTEENIRHIVGMFVDYTPRWERLRRVWAMFGVAV